MKRIKYTIRRLWYSFTALCFFLTPAWIATVLFLFLPHEGWGGVVREIIFSNTPLVFAVCLVQVGGLVFWTVVLADIWLWWLPRPTRKKGH